MFHDRIEAGKKLSGRLMHLRDENPIVFGLARGGVVVAAPVARALDTALDVLVVRKIGDPTQPELALGAVMDGPTPHIALNLDLIASINVDAEFIEAESLRQLQEVRKQNERFRRDRPLAQVEGRTAIVIDDGIATGATVQVAIEGLRQRGPKRIVLAIPVAPPDTVRRFEAMVDEVVCLHSPESFMAVGFFYEIFDQTTDDEVVQLLDQYQSVVNRP
ncbi:MAG: phosphoribosyltransferase family protein [Planctomycetota bacterium]|nr:phosphoribosyltransferase family protein [Planctomycetota bacterium]